MKPWECAKHTAQQEFAALPSQVYVLRAVAKPANNCVWKIIWDTHCASIQEAWKRYMKATCNCWDRETFRMGASWVSNRADSADVANLDDVSEA